MAASFRTCSASCSSALLCLPAMLQLQNAPICHDDRSALTGLAQSSTGRWQCTLMASLQALTGPCGSHTRLTPLQVRTAFLRFLSVLLESPIHILRGQLSGTGIAAGSRGLDPYSRQHMWHHWGITLQLDAVPRLQVKLSRAGARCCHREQASRHLRNHVTPVCSSHVLAKRGASCSERMPRRGQKGDDERCTAISASLDARLPVGRPKPLPLSL